jgi:hypothetical protein
MTPSMYQLSPGTEVLADATYSETTILARVVDPEDTPTKSDILLVTTSYQTPPLPGQTPEEVSLLMFDDGQGSQVNKFPYDQQFNNLEDCTIDIPNGICGCNKARYDLTANDVTAGDHIFTRGFAFVSPGAGVPSNALTLIDDCIAKANHQFPSAGTKFVGATVPLKIEAVDHEGNLTLWPTEPTTTIGTSSITPTDTSDKCAYCLVTASDPGSECRGLPGLIVTDPAAPFPLGGLCENLP